MKSIEPIDTNQIKDAHPEAWYAEKLTTINGVNLKYRVMRDTTAQFHQHDDPPEAFYVLSGTVIMDPDQGSLTLAAGQFYQIEPGISHRSRVVGEATLLVIDKFKD